MREPPRTLGDLSDGDLGLALECPSCGRKTGMFRDALIARHGREATIEAVGRAAVCSRCHHRGAKTHVVRPRYWRPAA
ncbi:hypothetical protein FHP25_33735 [Vineibacter terrae]|uniref:Uncharacterized protein n=1 Tax=Vineibacter terrae TaxID=2586908 RepID=A0A5C8P9Z2_9HYPH|nr:hypothetical protein [Vineibacter terrae]TXL70616.1 hypothetical protein FHP25_33735 [Vineibacter terrae]